MSQKFKKKTNQQHTARNITVQKNAELFPDLQ